MKVVNICLRSIVTDGWSYQDNLLPKYQKKLGNEVTVITSKYIRDKDADIVKSTKINYVNNDGIRVIRLDARNNKHPHNKFVQYPNLIKTIKEQKPDVLFIHGLQFLDVKKIASFCSENPNVRVFVDNHADFSNSATNWFSKKILHEIIWRKCASKIEPHVVKFFGVLPARCEFLKTVYKLPESKIDLLPLGVDDEIRDNINYKINNEDIRTRNNINNGDFLIVTGGKIDFAKKQSLQLMEAIKNIENKQIKLLVFGSVIEELKTDFFNLVDGEKIQYLGWLDSYSAMEVFAASDIAVFPGRHSVFWEQVAGLGIPLIVKYWEGTSHIDLEGNCEFLYDGTVEEIKEKIEYLLENPSVLANMKEVASEKGIEEFSYSKIAKQSIAEC
ncbi:glycosyl transferase family 1 [Alteribacter lacisalsi]|uniref:Glycosyl transferase family 1 n=1 Tax=Alteribacter lacisalsi TaxID=2045244 RepID=A0A2W0H3A7_9BACI|nr:glycosyl transferase family 1 [Alteribacter lacisalsi]